MFQSYCNYIWSLACCAPQADTDAHVELDKPGDHEGSIVQRSGNVHHERRERWLTEGLQPVDRSFEQELSRHDGSTILTNLSQINDIGRELDPGDASTVSMNESSISDITRDSDAGKSFIGSVFVQRDPSELQISNLAHQEPSIDGANFFSKLLWWLSDMFNCGKGDIGPGATPSTSAANPSGCSSGLSSHH